MATGKELHLIKQKNELERKSKDLWDEKGLVMSVFMILGLECLYKSMVSFWVSGEWDKKIEGIERERNTKDFPRE